MMIAKMRLYGSAMLLAGALLLCPNGLLGANQENGAAAPTKNKKLTGPTTKDYDWWRKARFGIFIHWGPSSVLALGAGSWQRSNNPKGDVASIRAATPGKLPEEILDLSYLKYYGQHLGPIPGKIYDNLYQIFNPTEFNAEEWVKVFKDAGAKYIVFTSKHHDGFCMFDSKYTDYDITSSPYKRDILKELTDACHKAGIKVLFYYSKPDWSEPRYDPHNPKPYEDFMVGQITELCTKYGEVKGFWWDGGNKVKIDGDRIARAILENQPGAIYNGRGGMNLPGLCFSTPEQRMDSFNRKKPWESCVPMMGEEWFWNGEKNLKSIGRCVNLLICSATGDGNLLLDFGPSLKGTISEGVKSVYLGMGRWLKKYGESIYGTRGGPYKTGTWGGATCAGKNVYLHITEKWPKGEIHLPPLNAKILGATALTGGNPEVSQNDKELVVKLDPKYHGEFDTIVKLELDREAFAIEPIPSENVEFVSLNATATASSFEKGWKGWPGSVTLRDFEVKMPKTKYFGEDATAKPKRTHGFKPDKETLKKYPWVNLGRDHIWRFWRAIPKERQPWLELDFGKPKTFNKVTILEKLDKIKTYILEYEKDGEWIVFDKGLRLGRYALALPKPITARKVRLKIIFWTGNDPCEGPGIRHFDFWFDKHN